ncbi:MAG: HU family DNA-binding protein [Pseudomonadota bacterium]
MARASTTKSVARKTTAKTTRKSTLQKVTTKPKASAKTSTTAVKTTTKAAPKPGVTAPKQAKVARELKKKELVERVTAAAGLKKPQARAAVEAMLDILGETIAKGEAMNLEPLGKMKVQNHKDAGAATVYACRLRRKKPSAVAPNAPLAAAAE